MTQLRTFVAITTVSLLACSSGSSPTSTDDATCTPRSTLAAASGNILNRAYVASRDSGNLTVIDLDKLEIAGVVETCATGHHMVEVNSDATKVYLSANANDTVEVLDARTLARSATVKVGAEPSHMSLAKDGRLLAVVDEHENAVSFIDTVTDRELKRLAGFFTPHFVRYAGRYAYVANLGAYHITRVDMDTLTIDGEIALDGYENTRPNAAASAPIEGFADAQIDTNGVLWAAHADTGRVLVYDTKAQKKLPELQSGMRPWIVYAEHPFASVDAHVVPNHGDLNVALLDRIAPLSLVTTGERESYGVNYSPLAPEKAFLMNRVRKEIAVLDTRTKKITAKIPVAGNTETASTTPDGRLIVATVGTANQVVIIDAQTNAIVKTFENVGTYPWTVTIPLGQNYCH